MKNVKKIVLAGDHYAVELVAKIEDYLVSKGIEFENMGSHSSDQKLALQEMIPSVVNKVSSEADGILVCGTGVGIEIGANRFKGVRASLCVSPRTAENARKYDNANVLCLSAWETNNPEDILDAWFDSEYDGNTKRLEMLEEFDRWAK